MSSLASPPSRSLPPLKCVQLALTSRSGSRRSQNEPSGGPALAHGLTRTAARERVATLPHVVDTISDFLDVAHPHIWTLPRACEKNLLYLAQRLGARLLLLQDLEVAVVGDDSDSDSNYPRETRLDPHYWSWQCSQALVSAVTHDNLDMVTWIHDYCPRVLPFAAMVEAARRGNVRLLEWLADRHPDAPWVPQMMDAAASTGELETLKWLHAHPKSVGCSDETMSSAIKGGHLETVKWLHEHTSVAPQLNVILAYDGIKNGHADVWWFLSDHEGRYGFRATEGIAIAALAGDLERLQSMIAKIPAPRVADSIGTAVVAAANAGHLHVVQWLHEHYSDAFSAEAMDYAAASGNLELMQWFHEHHTEGCTIDAMHQAASKGHLNVVQWLHEHRTEGCTTFAMDTAAGSGHLDVVQWLHEHRSEGCSSRAMDNAASNGHFDVVQWLHENRSEGCTTFAMDWAAKKGRLDIVKWLHEHRSEGCTTEAMDCAILYGHLDVVQWLHYNRTEGCTACAMRIAVLFGDLKAVKWLLEHRLLSYSSDAIVMAARHGHFDVLLFLHANRSEDILLGTFASTNLKLEHLEIVQWLERTYPDAIGLDTLRTRNPKLSAVLAYVLGSRT